MFAFGDLIPDSDSQIFRSSEFARQVFLLHRRDSRKYGLAADLTCNDLKCMNKQIMQEFNYPTLPLSDGESEWTYEMRRQMQEIIPGVFLGPYSAATKNKYEELRKHQITHIVCVRQALEAHFIRPNFPHLFNYLELDIMDSMFESIIQHIPRFVQFLDDCLGSGGKVLVHGNAGVSRSATLVIAYIMEKYGLCYRDAYDVVQQRRFCISPNERFFQQLKEYEPICRAKFTLRGNDSTQFKRCAKRSYDDLEGEMIQPSGTSS